MEQRRATSPLGQACPKGDVASFVFALCCPIGSSLPLKGKTTGGQLPITIKFPLPFVSLPPPVRFAVPPEGVKDGATKGFTPFGFASLCPPGNSEPKGQRTSVAPLGQNRGATYKRCPSGAKQRGNVWQSNRR